MLMRNPDYQISAEQAVQSSIAMTSTAKTHAPSDVYSEREMLLGHVVLLLLFVIAVLLRTAGM